jgi:hypothetical protein
VIAANCEREIDASALVHTTSYALADLLSLPQGAVQIASEGKVEMNMTTEGSARQWFSSTKIAAVLLFLILGTEAEVMRAQDASPETRSSR